METVAPIQPRMLLPFACTARIASQRNPAYRACSREQKHRRIVGIPEVVALKQQCNPKKVCAHKAWLDTQDPLLLASSPPLSPRQ